MSILNKINKMITDHTQNNVKPKVAEKFVQVNVSADKGKATEGFMSSLGKAKNVVQGRLETNTESFDNSFQDAVKMLARFAGTKDSNTLKNTGKEFLKLIRLKPSRVEPYVYMAYILYLYGKKEEALKFIKLSESLDPDYKFTKKIKACIYS